MAPYVPELRDLQGAVKDYLDGAATLDDLRRTLDCSAIAVHEPSDPATDFFAADIDLSIAEYSPGGLTEDE